MPTVQIVIEGDDSGFSGTLDDLDQKIQRVGNSSDGATGKMTAGFGNARIVTDLLTGNVSRAEQALVRLGARTELLGPIISLAFAPAAIYTFVTLAETAVSGIEKLVESFTHAQQAADELSKSAADLDKYLGNNQQQLERLQNAYATVGLSGIDLLTQKNNEAKTSVNALTVQLTLQQQEQQKLNDLLTSQAQLGATHGVLPGALVPQQQLDEAKQRLTELPGLIERTKSDLDVATQSAANMGKALASAVKEQDLQILERYNETLAKTLGLNEQLSTLSQERAPGSASLMGMPTPYGDESLNFIDTGAARSTQAFKDLDSQMMVNMAADQKVAEQGEESAKRYAEAWTRARDTMANQLDSFFSELTSGNIAQAFLKQFEKLVSQMVATWLMGIGGMQQAVTRSGGLFGSLFGLGEGGSSGSLFRGGASALSTAIPGVDASFMNGSDMSGILSGNSSSLIGVPLSGGGGAASVSLSALPAGASNIGSVFGGSGASGGFLSMLGRLAPIGALAGGAALLGKGGVAGLLGSGALGYGAGAVAGPLLAAVAAPLMESGVISGALAGTLETIAPFLGPIGAGIGLVAGLIGLFGGDGKLKTQQANLQNQEQTDLVNLENSFSLHQIDYNSAIAQAEQIRQSYTQQQEALKKGGSVGRVDAVVNDIEQQINNIEQQRENVLGAAPNYGPAQFERGGFVHPSMARLAPPGFAPAMHFATGGAVPAIVHAGEYVLNARTVNRLGVRNLDAANAGSSGGGDTHLHFNAIDMKSFEGYLRSGGFDAIAREIQRAKQRGSM